MDSRLVSLSRHEKHHLESGRESVRVAFWMIMFAWALPVAAQSDPVELKTTQRILSGNPTSASEAANLWADATETLDELDALLEADRAQDAEEPADTAEGELTEEQIEALIQARREKRRKERMKRRAFLPDKNYNQEFLAIIGLLLLWLYTRKHNREVEARRPVRANPLSPDELGRVLFGLAQSGDALAYRALYLTGSEAQTIMGQREAEAYLEQRTGRSLQEAFRAMAAKIPQGATYQECSISEEVCTLVVGRPDGEKATIVVGRVALVGAVIRLLSPVVERG